MKRLFMIVLNQFKERKLRTFLTILGISIGIAALVSLILLGQSLKQGIVGQLDSFGSDEILIAPKASTGTSAPSGTGLLTMDDVNTLESIPQIIEIDALISKALDVEFGREKGKFTVSAGDVASQEILEDYIDMDIVEGRFIQLKDSYSVNIGYRLAKEAFDKEIYVGNSLLINEDKYKVVGIFEEQGNIEKDEIIVAPVDSLRKTISDEDAVTAIRVKVAPGADIDLMVERIKDRLERARGAEDLGVVTPKQIQEQIGSILGVVNIVVIGIAVISLIVSAFGIMNSLYTSVMQRVKEIGTMKAVGAKNSQIAIIFLIESALLGFGGGVCGVIVGLILAYGLINVINMFGIFRIELGFNIGLIIGALLFSTFLGILSGLLPALNASKLKPVDALRYE